MMQGKAPSQIESPFNRRNNRFRNRSLEAAAVAIAATGAAETVNAAIIYDGAVNASTGTTFSLDGTVLGEIQVRTGMMGADLFLNANAAMGAGSTVQLSVFSSGGMMATDFLSQYTLGDTVDGSLTYATRGYMVDDPVTNPSWAAGELAYAGFTFDTGGGTLYGWLQIQFDVSGTDFTVTQSAYDDSGLAINVGTVPEPGTALLLGLGLAGLGVYARKRSRAFLAAGAS